MTRASLILENPSPFYSRVWTVVYIADLWLVKLDEERDSFICSWLFTFLKTEELLRTGHDIVFSGEEWEGNASIEILQVLLPSKIVLSLFYLNLKLPILLGSRTCTSLLK